MLDLEKNWQATMQAVVRELQDLAWQREQMNRITRIVNENPDLLHGGNLFPWDLRRWYMVFAAMALRRQTDKSDDVHSLRSLLESLKENSRAFTRNTVAKIFGSGAHPYDGAFLARLVDATWKQFVGADGITLNAEAVAADIKRLSDVSRRVKLFADKVLAHATKSGFPEKTLPTFNEIDNCVDEFEAVAIRYCSLLTGLSYTTLLPTEQFNWWKIWNFPWRPSPNTLK